MTRVAIIHDWLTGMRGGESVLEAIIELFPTAELFTLICIPDKISPTLKQLKTHTSWLQKIPGAKRRYRHFLPWMPGMIEQFDLSHFDLILSSSHCVAKGIQKSKNSLHISYIHAPMRYIWDRFDDYFGPGRTSWITRLGAHLLRKKLQTWDQKVSTPSRIDHILTNSQFIASQIRNHYGREAQVVYPFAHSERFTLPRKPENYYLMVTAFAPYKKVDIAIEAFNQLRLPLWIVGSGQDEILLKNRSGPQIRFLGSTSNQAIAELYSKCKALIFPGIEDFGITPLEAMAAGAPVIAYGEGGARETLQENTGIFFTPQSSEALISAVQIMESQSHLFPESACRQRGKEFSRQRFQKNFMKAIQEYWTASGKPPLTFN